MKKVEKDGNAAELLKIISGVSREVDINASIYDAIDEAKWKYYTYRQQPYEDNDHHARVFKRNVEVLEHEGGELFNDPILIKHEKQKDIGAGVTAKSDEEYKAIVREKAMATALLKRADQGRCKNFMTNIRDQHGYAIDVYPKILASAHDMLENYVKSRGILPKK